MDLLRLLFAKGRATHRASLQPKVAGTSGTSLFFHGKQRSSKQYNQKLPRSLPREAVCAHKTGEVTGVIHDAGIITGPKGKFVIVCLSQNLDDVEKGDHVIGEIARWAYDLLN